MRRRFALTVVMMFLTALAFAQNANLQLNRIMDGKIVPLDRMVVTKVRGALVQAHLEAPEKKGVRIF